MDPHRLRALRHVGLDMDGTIYQGSHLFEWTAPFLDLLDDLGIGYSFITNNSSRSAAEHAEYLNHLGLRKVARTQVYTSNLASIRMLGQQRPAAHRIFALGTAAMKSEWREAGYRLVGESDEGEGEEEPSEPDVVVVGFDRTLTYERLCQAAYWIERGRLFLATHPDPFCPTDQPTCLVDCGALCACLTRATGREPDLVLGKPNPQLIRTLMRHHHLEPNELAFVGDRLSTDIVMANRAGVLGVHVLSGDHGPAQRANEAARPDLSLNNLQAFGALLREAVGDRGEAVR